MNNKLDNLKMNSGPFSRRKTALPSNERNDKRRRNVSNQFDHSALADMAIFLYFACT